MTTKEIISVAPKIDVLINGDGDMAIDEYIIDEQGIKIQLSAHYVGQFLLTNLYPALIAAGSRSAEPALAIKDHYRWAAYSQVMAANILFSCGLIKGLDDRGVTTIATRPGYDMKSNWGTT
ncbi:hypothetical protein M434DRAFT_34050 [Hypoxylon sp. CO27-5]|nr:hypothetical protein M434DRAFT_34050 [Hypoxylon sp. CO27-5]